MRHIAEIYSANIIFLSEKTFKKTQLKLKRRLDSILKVNRMIAKTPKIL